MFTDSNNRRINWFLEPVFSLRGIWLVQHTWACSLFFLCGDMSKLFVVEQALANLVTEEDLAQGRLYPPLSSIRDVSLKLAVKVRAGLPLSCVCVCDTVKLYCPPRRRSWSTPTRTTWQRFTQSRPTKTHSCTRSPTPPTTTSLSWTRTAGQTAVWPCSRANFEALDRNRTSTEEAR